VEETAGLELLACELILAFYILTAVTRSSLSIRQSLKRVLGGIIWSSFVGHALLVWPKDMM
jgi:hypothetical protein